MEDKTMVDKTMEKCRNDPRACSCDYSVRYCQCRCGACSSRRYRLTGSKSPSEPRYKPVQQRRLFSPGRIGYVQEIPDDDDEEPDGDRFERRTFPQTWDATYDNKGSALHQETWDDDEEGYEESGLHQETWDDEEDERTRFQKIRDSDAEKLRAILDATVTQRFSQLNITSSPHHLVQQIERRLRIELSQEVKAAFMSIDRKLFLPESLKHHAYEDVPLADATSRVHHSAPHIYAHVLGLLGLRPGLTFLNVGSGTGYLSTLVAWLLGDYNQLNHGIEISPELVSFAQSVQQKFTPPYRIQFKCGNAFDLADSAKDTYDVIYIGAECDYSQVQFFCKFLTDQGQIIAPMNRKFIKMKKTGKFEVCFPCQFAPIKPASLHARGKVAFDTGKKPLVEEKKGATGVVTIITQNGVTVAKKIARTEELDEYILSEANNLIRVHYGEERHPNIVALQSIGYERQRPFLLLEPLKRTLYEVGLNPRHYFRSAQDLLLVIHDCVQGLMYLHSLSIMHLDISDTNIMLDSYNRAKLIDLAFSRPFPSEKQKSECKLPLVGKDGFRDDKRINTRSYGPEVDIFSMGKVIKLINTWCQLYADKSNIDKTLDKIIARCTDDVQSCRPTAAVLADWITSIITVDIPLVGNKSFAELMNNQSDVPISTDVEKQFIMWDKHVKALNQAPKSDKRSIWIASWNMCQLGKSKEKLNAIVKTIDENQLDIVAVQEVLTDDALEEIKHLLSHKQRINWHCKVSQRVGNNEERLGFLWRSPAILECAALPEDPLNLWIRRPYYAKFHVGKTRVLLCTTHIWQKKPKREIVNITNFINALRQAGHLKSVTKVILLGDFNLDPTAIEWKDLVALGWTHLIDRPTNLKNNRCYDNIWIQQEKFMSVLSSRVIRPPSSDMIKTQWSDHCPVAIQLSYEEGSEFQTSEFRRLVV